ILYAVTAMVQVVQLDWTTHPVGLTGSWGVTAPVHCIFDAMSQLGALSPPLEVACVRSLRFSRWPVSSLSAPGVRGRSTLRLVRASGSDSGSGTGRSGSRATDARAPRVPRAAI